MQNKGVLGQFNIYPKKWYWNEVHQQAFDDVKATIAKDVVLAYPDFNEEFEIYTDGSKNN